MQTLKHPTLAFVFALILIGYTSWDLDQLSGKRYSRAGASLSLARVPAATVPALAGAEPGALASGALMSGDAPSSPPRGRGAGPCPQERRVPGQRPPEWPLGCCRRLPP